MSKREKRREQRERKFWTDREAKATTPGEVAVLEFDRLRATLRRLPGPVADPVWDEVADTLAKHRRKITQGELHK